MGAFASSDITYALVNQRKMSDSRNLNRVRLTFGAGAETYATNGIPLSKGKMGCPTVIESLIVVDKGNSGYSFMYDQSAEKLILFVAPVRTHTHDLLLVDNVVADGATTRVNAGANKLGANTGANITVAGSGANGGIVSTTLAPAALSELANGTDIATQVIEVEVIGW
jgi:hypothetical protein